MLFLLLDFILFDALLEILKDIAFYFNFAIDGLYKALFRISHGLRKRVVRVPAHLS